eukprot:929043-Amorphochlora_amoeboformis.AAC.1
MLPSKRRKRSSRELNSPRKLQNLKLSRFDGYLERKKGYLRRKRDRACDGKSDNVHCESNFKRKKLGEDKIRVCICLQNGRKVPMALNLDDTIAEVQMQLYELYQVSSESIMYDGKLVGRYSTCKDIGIRCGGTLFLHQFSGMKDLHSL